MWQQLQSTPTAIYFALAILGLCVGSFIRMVAHRLPIIMLNRDRASARSLLHLPEQRCERTFNLASPRSHCPQCGRAIAHRDNIPILSYLLLQGRCRHCNLEIGLSYPMTEIVAAGITLAPTLTLGLGPEALLLTALGWLCLTMALIDLEQLLLPDGLVFTALWLGLLANMWGLFASLEDAILGVVAGYLVLWGMNQAFLLVRGRAGMGQGDFKLCAALGAWLGWQYLPTVLLSAALCGLVFALPRLALRRSHFGQPIPFGPWLALSGWCLLLWKEQFLTLLYFRP